MRVLTLTNLYPPHAYGGYEWTCFDAMRVFREHGHEVTVLTSNAALPGSTDVAEPGVHRSLEPWWDWDSQAARTLTKPARLPIARHNQRVLSRTVAEVRPDVVSVWHLGGMGLNLLTELENRGIPIVAMVEDDWLIYGNGLDVWTRTFRARPRLGRLTATLLGVPTSPPTLRDAVVVFASQFTRDKSARDSGYSMPDAKVIPLGVDTHDFPIVDRAPRPWNWRLLYVGRMAPQKGIETLARSFARLPAEAHLELVGDGDRGYRPKFHRLVGELGIRGRLEMGAAPRAALADRYRDADVVIFPSEWDEPFGIVPLEAMACGVPVIATGTGGSAEFLVDGLNCRLYDAGDVAQLTAAIHELAADERLRSRLVAGGRDTARRLTVTRFATDLLRVHEAAVDPTGTSAH
jgi:glycosyltransferase involved in cell wall biosynthesis